MKKIMYLLSVGVIVSLIGCGTAPVVNTPTPTVSAVDQAKTKQVEDGQKAIADLKAKATKADFIEINGHYDQVKAKPVFFDGDTVKIYGMVSNPKEGLGMPTIMCSVIEKK